MNNVLVMTVIGLLIIVIAVVIIVATVLGHGGLGPATPTPVP